jgi:excisionase family DNA binding protein
VITAKKVYREILEMPVKEREKLFAVIARQGFEKDLYVHAEVFENLDEPFTITEAAEYLEVADITVRRWAKEGVLKSGRVGRNIVFDPDDLRNFKHARKRISHNRI